MCFLLTITNKEKWDRIGKLSMYKYRMVKHVTFVSVLRREIALHEACKTNNVVGVHKVLEEKIDINCKNNVRPLTFR